MHKKAAKKRIAKSARSPLNCNLFSSYNANTLSMANAFTRHQRRDAFGQRIEDLL
jgi:hypothetical protein